MKFTRCMAQKSFTHLIFFNSAAIIGNANKADSTIFDFHSNCCCFRINSIFQQLLYNRRWSVNNLSCCNLINRCLIEQLYFGHCRPPLYIFNFYIFDASHGLLRSFAALAIRMRVQVPSSDMISCKQETSLSFSPWKHQMRFFSVACIRYSVLSASSGVIFAISSFLISSIIESSFTVSKSVS